MSIERCESTKQVIQAAKEKKKSYAQLIEQYEAGLEDIDQMALNAFNIAVCYEEANELKNAHDQYTYTAGQLDYPPAYCNLGVLYFHGKKDVEKDQEKAVAHFQKAAELGNATAQYNLAECYRNGWGVDKSHYDAFKYFKQAALQKLPKAQDELAKCHLEGFGVATFAHDGYGCRNYEIESKNDPYAAFRLAIHYLYGIGTGQNLVEGLRLLREHAYYLKYLKSNPKDTESGADYFTPILPKFLKKVVEQDPNISIREFNQYGDSQYRDGKSDTGYPNKNKYYKNAFRAFSLAAALGSAEALYKLGRCYENGQGVDLDNFAALKYYRLSAQQNYTEAQNGLIRLYAGCKGIPYHKDAKDEAAYYEQEMKNDTYAEFRRGICCFNGHGTNRDFQEGLRLIKKNAVYLKFREDLITTPAIKLQLNAMLESTSPDPIMNIQEDFSTPTDIKDFKEMSGEERKRTYQNAANVVKNILTNPVYSSNSYNPKGECTILMHLAFHGFTALVRDLLQKNPDLALRDQQHGRTALHWAALTGNYLIVKALLDFLVQEGREDLIDAPDVNGVTPLMLAASAGYLDVVRLLCKANADPNKFDPQKHTALWHANQPPKKQPVVSFLTVLSTKKIKESKTQLVKDSKDQNAAEAETDAIQISALEYIAAIKDPDHRQSKASLEIFFASALTLDPTKLNELKADELAKLKTLSETQKRGTLKDTEYRELKNLEARHQYAKDFAAVKEIFKCVDNRGKSIKNYAIEQNNIYVKNQLIALAAKLNDPTIASGILQNDSEATAPTILKENKDTPAQIEARSKELQNLIAMSLKLREGNPAQVDELLGDARKNHLQKVKTLIEQGINLFFAPANGHNIFLYLIFHGYSSQIRQILQTSSDETVTQLITEKNSPNQTFPLRWAAQMGNPEIVSMLIEALKKANLLDKNINEPSGSNLQTPLMAAIEHKHIHAAKLLIAAGANFDTLQKPSIKKTSYQLAQEFGLTELTIFMDAFKAAGDKTAVVADAKDAPKQFTLTDQQRALTLGMFEDTPKDEEKSLSPEQIRQGKERCSQMLINAIKNDDHEKTQTLVLQNFDPNYRDKDGFNVLDHAAIAGDTDLVLALIKNPAVDINAVADGYGKPTTLDLAANFGRRSIVEALLKAGAKFAPIKTLDKSLINEADAKNGRENTSHEIDRAKEKAKILFEKATKVVHTPTISQLQKQGLVDSIVKTDTIERKHEVPKETKPSPLFHAVKTSDVKNVRALLSTDPSFVTEKDEDEYTPLHWAAQHGDVEMMQALMEHNADIEAKDSAGLTPLLIAVLHHKESAIRYLVKIGADIHVQDNREQTLSDYADLYPETLSFLKDKERLTLLHSKYLAEKIMTNNTFEAPENKNYVADVLDELNIVALKKEHKNQAINVLIQDLTDRTPLTPKEANARLIGFTRVFKTLDLEAEASVSEVIMSCAMERTIKSATTLNTVNLGSMPTNTTFYSPRAQASSVTTAHPLSLNNGDNASEGNNRILNSHLD